MKTTTREIPGKEVAPGTIYDLLRVAALYRDRKGGKPAWRKLRKMEKSAEARRSYAGPVG